MIYRCKRLKIHFFLWIFFSGNILCLNGNEVRKEIVVTILNQSDLSIVSDVTLLTKNGSIQAVSDINGVLRLDISLLQKKDTIYFHHLNFADKKLTVDDMITSSTIFLKPEVFNLSEIVITPTNKDYTHYVLKAYFRTWQYENETPKYFMDGIIEFHMPLSDEKKKIKENLLQYRKFRNKKLIKSEQRKIMTVSLGTFGSPRIHIRPKFDRLYEGYFKKRFVRSENGYLHYEISAKNEERKYSENISGKAILDSLLRQIEIEIIENIDFKKEIKFLGYRAKPLISTYAEEYAVNNDIHHLLYKKSYSKDLFRRKKEDSKIVENFREVFVLNIKLENEDQFKKTKNQNNSKNTRSFYIENFWENKKISPLPVPIKNQLGKTLILYNNNYKNKDL